MNITGIDLGNSRTKVAVPDPQGNPVILVNQNGLLYLDSVVFVGDKEPIVGIEAFHAGLAEPRYCIINWKRHLGTDKILATAPDGTEYTARDAARLILKKTKADVEAKTGEPMHEVVISVPANFTDNRKNDIQEVAASLDMKVLRMPSEPVAAAIGNDLHKGESGLILVVDIGGSTSDITIMKKEGNNFKEILSDAEVELGGQDYNVLVREKVLAAFAEKHGLKPTEQEHPLTFLNLWRDIEQAKISLSQREKAMIAVSCNGHVLNLSLTRAEFLALTAALTEKIVLRVQDVLKQVRMEPQQINKFLLVGGASRTCGVAEALEKCLGIKPYAHVEPDYAAARGNMIIGRLEIEKSQPFKVGNNILPPLNYFVQEVTTHPIGICVLSQDDRLINSVILPKGTRIPSIQTKRFRLADKHQTAARIELLQGPDGAPKDECLLLGYFQLEDIAHLSGDIHPIDVRLELDLNGMLTAVAYDPQNGREAKLTLAYKKSKENKP